MTGLTEFFNIEEYPQEFQETALNAIKSVEAFNKQAKGNYPPSYLRVRFIAGTPPTTPKCLPKSMAFRGFSYVHKREKRLWENKTTPRSSGKSEFHTPKYIGIYTKIGGKVGKVVCTAYMYRYIKNSGKVGIVVLNAYTV